MENVVATWCTGLQITWTLAICLINLVIFANGVLIVFLYYIPYRYTVAADCSIASGSLCIVIVTPEIPHLKLWTLQDE